MEQNKTEFGVSGASKHPLERRTAERRAVRAELAALSRRARDADLPSIALVLDLAAAMDESEDWPPRPSDSILVPPVVKK